MPKPKRRLKHDSTTEEYLAQPIVVQRGINYTTPELAKILRTSTNSIYVQRCKGTLQIPATYPNGKPLFSGDAILDHLASKTHPDGATRKRPRVPSPGRPRKQRAVA